MKRLAMSFFLVLALAGAAMASGPLDVFKGQKGTIDIAGGTAHIPVMKGAAKNIMEINPDIRISVTGGGTGVGIQKVGEGMAQIGNTGRAVTGKEIQKYDLVTFPFAIDGVAATVNKANPVRELSKAQLADIYSGKITNWKDVGGKDAPISLFAREDGSGTRDTFDSLAINKGQTAASANIVNSNGAMKTAIMQDENALGYVGIGHLDDQIAGLTLDGMVPSQENASNESYKVTRLLYMNTKGQPTGLVKDFIDYIYTDDGEKIIRASGYIPVKRQ